ncbi:MAG: tetratricopeptide repeat protein [Planctomycetota bacterium]
METLPTAWETFFEQIRRPRLLLQGVVEYGSAWVFTRRWLGLLLYLPFLLVFGGACALALLGSWVEPKSLASTYLELAEEEVTSSDTAGADDSSKSDDLLQMEEEEVTEYGQLLLRRVLQLEPAQNRATFLVANQLGKSGRGGQARRMMRGLAPAEGDGFAPAHAWLAIDQLRRPISSAEAKDELTHDLRNAVTWGGAGTGLIAGYSQLLANDGEVGAAHQVLEQAVSSGRPGSERLEAALADLAYRSGRRKTLDETTQKVKNRVRERMENKTATVEDYVALGQIFLFQGEPDKAIEVVRQANKNLGEDNERLRRIASEGWRIKYRESLVESQGQSVKLGWLDRALKIDPTNPAISQEIAALIAMGRGASDELVSALNTQIAEGNTTALTHILLADKEILQAEYQKAISHLQIALRQAPRNPTILNNLGLCLALLQNPSFEEAEKRVTQALSVAPENAEYWDSLGEIRRLAGDLPGAVEALERAIGLDPSRVNSREKLADVFTQMGLDDMAKIQRDEIEKQATEQSETQ